MYIRLYTGRPSSVRARSMSPASTRQRSQSPPSLAKVVCMNVRIHTCADMCARVYRHMHRYVLTHVGRHESRHMRRHGRMHVCWHACRHACRHVCRHACRHVCRHQCLQSLQPWRKVVVVWHMSMPISLKHVMAHVYSIFFQIYAETSATMEVLYTCIHA